MPVLTSREFNQGVSRAKRAANDGPVVITDRGRPAYVLMRHETYRRLCGGEGGIRALLSHPESEQVEFEPPRLGDDAPQPPSLEKCFCSTPPTESFPSIQPSPANARDFTSRIPGPTGIR
jgi:hypothetical protein